MAWGNESAGGKIPRKFRDQITGIRHVHASNTGFLAITEDTAYSWGSPYVDKIKLSLPESHSVEKVVASSEAFAILTDQGAVLTLGNGNLGGSPAGSMQADLSSGLRI